MYVTATWGIPYVFVGLGGKGNWSKQEAQAACYAVKTESPSSLTQECHVFSNIQETVAG